jgi:hypothetical protein
MFHLLDNENFGSKLCKDFFGDLKLIFYIAPINKTTMEPIDELTKQEDNPLTPLAVMHLKDTAPWVKFLGIFGIVIAVIYFLGGIVSLVQSPMLGIIFMIFSAFYFFLFNLLNQFGRNISRFIKNKEPLHLEMALRKQQTFWMISGILTIIALVCIALFMVFAGGTFLHLLNQSKGITM